MIPIFMLQKSSNSWWLKGRPHHPFYNLHNLCLFFFSFVYLPDTFSKSPSCNLCVSMLQHTYPRLTFKRWALNRVTIKKRESFSFSFTYFQMMLLRNNSRAPLTKWPYPFHFIHSLYLYGEWMERCCLFW